MKTIEFSKSTSIDFPVSDFQAGKHNTSNIVHVEQDVHLHFRIYKTNTFIHWAYITINKNQGHEFEKEQVRFYGRCGGRKGKIEERNDVIALQSQQKGINNFINCRRYYLKIKMNILLIKNEQKLITVVHSALLHRRFSNNPTPTQSFSTLLFVVYLLSFWLLRGHAWLTF